MAGQKRQNPTSTQKKKKRPVKKKEGKKDAKKEDWSIDEIVAEEQETVDNFHQDGGQ